MPVVRHRRTYLTIRSRVFVGSFGIVRVAEPGVPTIEAGNFVADEGGVAPAWSPVNRLADGGWHDHATVIGHIGIVAFWRASKWIEASSPVNPEHGRLVLAVDRRQILTSGTRRIGSLTETHGSEQ